MKLFARKHPINWDWRRKFRRHQCPKCRHFVNVGDKRIPRRFCDPNPEDSNVYGSDWQPLYSETKRGCKDYEVEG